MARYVAAAVLLVWVAPADARAQSIVGLEESPVTVLGAAAGDRAFEASDAGDIDGDGVDDLLLGAALAGESGTGDGGGALVPAEVPPGRAYLLYGTSSLPERIDLAAPGALRVTTFVPGAGGGGWLGYAASGAGDVNGDGSDDLVVSAVRAFDGGAAWIVYGGRELPPVVDLSHLDSLGVELVGPRGSAFGRSVSGAGDWNRDGFDDVVAGAVFDRTLAPLPGDDEERIAGGAYIVFGGPDLPSRIEAGELGARGVRVRGVAPHDFLGGSVADAGDFDGDGVADVIVGAEQANPRLRSDAGAAWVLFGTASPPAEIDLAALPAGAGVAVLGPSSDEHTGSTVAGAGDFDGDGVEDLLVGARRAAPGGVPDAGRAWVVFGGGRSPAEVDLAAPPPGRTLRIDGTGRGDFLGQGADGIGDFDQDGLDDVILGAERADPDGRLDAGQAFIIFGAASPPAAVDIVALGARGVRLDGAVPGDEAGRKAVSAGDLNADGLPDVVVCALKASPEGREEAGVFHVLPGTPVPTPLDPVCVAGAEANAIRWTNPEPYDAVRVERNGEPVAELSGDATSFRDPDPVIGLLEYGIVGVRGDRESLPAVCRLSVEVLSPASLACTSEDGEVVVTWTHRHPAPLDGTRILRDGEEIAVLAGDARVFRDPDPGTGSHEYTLEAVLGDTTSLPVRCEVTVPAPPRDLACRADGCDVVLEWSHAALPDAIELRRDGEVAGKPAAGPRDTFTDRDLAPGTYEYEVRSVTAEGTSAPARCTVRVLPALQGLEGRSLAGDVELVWEPAAEADAILVARDGAPRAELPADATGFLDPGVAPGSHEYVVRAVVGADRGKPASVVVEVVSPVEDVAACADGRSVEVTWTTGDTYDEVEVLRDGMPVAREPGGATSFIDTVDGPRAPVYAVVGRRGNGAAAAVEAQAVVPAAPAGLSAEHRDGALQVAWKNAGPYDGIEVRVNDEALEPLPGDVQQTVVPADPGAFRIEVRGLVEGEAEGCVHRSEPARVLVDAAFGLECTNAGSDVRVAWTAAVPLDVVRIVRDGELVAEVPGETGVFDDTVPGAGAYRYEVVGGTGAFETAPVICRVTVLPAVAGLACSTGGETVTLEWRLPEAATPESVLLLRDGEELAVLPGDTTGYADPDPGQGPHRYGVRLVSASGPGVMASCDIEILAAPEEVTCRGEGTGVTLEWTPPAGAAGVVVLRDGIEVSPPGGLAGDAEAFVDTDVAPGEHCWTVYAVSGAGRSPLAGPCCLDLPLAPVRLGCEVFDAVASLAWENPRAYDALEVRLDGARAAELDGSATTWTDPESPLSRGAHRLEVRGRVGDAVSAPAACDVVVPEPASRLECRQDGAAVSVRWTLDSLPDAVRIYRDGEQVAAFPAAVDEAIFLDEVPPGPHTWAVRTVTGDAVGLPVECALDVMRAPRDLVCTRLPEAGGIELSWANGDDYDAVLVFRDGDLLTEPPLEGGATSFVDPGAGDDARLYEVAGTRGGDTSARAAVDCGLAVRDLACSLENGRSVRLAWTLPPGTPLEALEVERLREADGATELRSLAGDATGLLDEGLEPGRYRYVVRALHDGGVALSRPCRIEVPAGFLRGEVNGDGRLDIADPIRLLDFLWERGPPPTCRDAGDVNDDGLLDIADATSFIRWQFDAGPVPPPPFEACGADPTDDPLGCDGFPLDLCP